MSMQLRNVLRVEDPLGLVYYLGTLTPPEIKLLTFVPVVTSAAQSGILTSLNEKEEHGYQRAGDPKRMRTIRDFVMENPSCVIPPVLLSARGQWKFTPVSSNKNFGTLEADELAAIIDGQHRLGGLWLLASEKKDDPLTRRPIPFMAIEQMSIDQERQNFIDINDTQQGVKKSLLRFLQKEDNFLGQATRAMMEDEESVFYGRIGIQRKDDSHILLFGAMQECIALLYDRDFTSTKKFYPDKDAESKTKAIAFVLEYWKCIEECLAEFWSDIEKLPPIGAPKSQEHPGTRAFRYRLLEETGIRAVSKLGSDIFTKTWIAGSSAPSWENVRQILSKIGSEERVQVALSKARTDERVLALDPDLKSTGKAGVAAIYKYLKEAFLQT